MNKFITEWKKRFPNEDLPANLIDYLESGDFTEYKRKFKNRYPDKVEFVEWYEKNKGQTAIEIIEACLGLELIHKEQLEQKVSLRSNEYQFELGMIEKIKYLEIKLDQIIQLIKEQENEH